METTAPTAVAVQRTAQAFSLAPRNLTEAMEFSKLMASSELVPKNFKGKPGDVLIAVQMGAEVGLAPMAAIQNIAVINGKPGIYGDAGKAILLAAGVTIEEDDTELIQKNGMARCRITRQGRPPVERTFSIENAKTAGLWNKEGPWRSYPYRQMAWRAFWFAARDAASDLLKGLGGAEELVDIEPREINPRSGASVAAAAAEKVEQHDDATLSKIADLEVVAKESGRKAFRATWAAIDPAIQKKVGIEERNRLDKMAGEADESRTVEGQATVVEGPTDAADADGGYAG